MGKVELLASMIAAYVAVAYIGSLIGVCLMVVDWVRG
jgi:hypothetical protein